MGIKHVLDSYFFYLLESITLRHRGAEYRIDEGFPVEQVFTPFDLKGLELKNRVVMAPMAFGHRFGPYRVWRRFGRLHRLPFLPTSPGGRVVQRLRAGLRKRSPGSIHARMVLGRLIPGRMRMEDGRRLYGAHYQLKLVQTDGDWRLHDMDYHEGWVSDAPSL